MRGILTTAVADEVILRNPCVVKGAGQEHSPERPMLSIAEVDAFTAAMPEPWRIAVEVAAWCHLRVGEVLGLERRDVDLVHAASRWSGRLTKSEAAWSSDDRRQQPASVG